MHLELDFVSLITRQIRLGKVDLLNNIDFIWEVTLDYILKQLSFESKALNWGAKDLTN